MSIQLAKDTSDFTTYNIVPSTKICTRVCLPLLEGAIDAGKLQETFPPEHKVDISVEKDVPGDYSPPKDPKDPKPPKPSSRNNSGSSSLEETDPRPGTLFQRETLQMLSNLC